MEEEIVTALGSFVSGRIWPNRFPQSNRPTWPAIRYTFISRVPDVDLCGDGGDETADVRIQLDCVSSTYEGVQTLRGQVMTAMAMFQPPAIWDGEFNVFEEETKTHRCALDYLVYP